VSLWGRPWLVISLFLQGNFDLGEGPNEPPMAGRGVIAALVVSALAILGGFVVVGSIWPIDALDDCATHHSRHCTSDTGWKPPVVPGPPSIAPFSR
jgi:hypothetical protein